jgi:signal transduction histidine kinase
VPEHNHSDPCVACDELVAHERESRASAERANRAKDNFFLTLSHELRGPLNAIAGWTGILRTRVSSDSLAVRAIDTVERNLAAQSRLITDMLDMSYVVTGKIRLVHAPVDLAALVVKVAEATRPLANGREIRLEHDSMVGTISADADRLRQVTENLLHNALKFTPSGGHVVLRLARDADVVTMAVQDTGMGIRADALPHVFDRFWQDDDASSVQTKGLGLGLAIVRHLVELHGGTIRAASDGPNHGATFTVTLPIAANAIDGTSSSPTASPA